jgi:hypothetical protein
VTTRNTPDKQVESGVVKEYIAAKDNLDEAYHRFDKAKSVARSFMNSRKAEEIIDDTHVIRLKENFDYDKTRLKQILEMVPQEDLINSGGYTPATTRMTEVPEKWDMRKILQFRRRGEDIARLLDKIKVVKSFKFEVEARRK